ncbi:MAG TPA: SDR family oxidoreductase [Acidobacteriota bacterium]|nr:SDR family oxidoreductase [Acidobacteriota bacterium]
MRERPVVLVTGGARGIGAAIARHFSRKYDVLFTYNRSKQSAHELLAEISAHCKANALNIDVSKEEQVRQLFELCKNKFGRLDVLVCNASYSSPIGWNIKPTEFNWEEWEKTIQVDLKGTMLCCHEAFKIMEPQKSGKIINFSSSAALWGDVPTYLYTAAKCAIVGVTRTLSRAFAPYVQVNAVAPGSINTDWIEKWKLTPHDVEAIAFESLLKRIGKPEEVAELVAFLASPTCTFITGQTIAIDGGILNL